MIAAVAARASGLPEVALRPRQSRAVAFIDWRDFAPSELMRRRLNLETHLDDYPEPNRVQPTRLGNILRRWEDETGARSVESVIDESFDQLPFSLQVTHDEQRGRLDLYCSMTFVSAALGILALGRFAVSHFDYAVFGLIAAVLGALASYRAALASARYYGKLLVVIAEFVTASGPPAVSNASVS